MGPDRHVLSSELRITPAPAQTIERMCFFGNRLTFLTIETAHRKLIVKVDTSVEIDRRAPLERKGNAGLRSGAGGSLRQRLAR